MATTLKLVVTSKLNLQDKYGAELKTVQKLFDDLVKADKARQIDTRVVYIDNAASATKAGITAVKSITRQTVKRAVDALYKKNTPAYLVIFGAQDIIPFQELKNPTDDDDHGVPSDLPYACEAAYSTDVTVFTGPTRVMGRIPDVPGKADIKYLKTVFGMLESHKPVECELMQDYFAVTADVWKSSTRESLANIFGNGNKLKNSPPSVSGYPAKDLKPLTHFYNCHGSPADSRFYGQSGVDYPTAQWAGDLAGHITPGTIVAAECCFGAEVFNPENDEGKQMSIANTYFANKAIAFLGSSTIAYGPASGQGLADLITQYFIKNVIAGASLGRAFLEARQKFLAVVGPDLEPFELKTLAQFYLLGDPATQVVIETVSKSGTETIENRRLNLFNKGQNLQNTMAPAQKVESTVSMAKAKEPAHIRSILKEAGFTGNEKQATYQVNAENKESADFAKNITGAATSKITFKTYIQQPKELPKEGQKALQLYDVLVIKENGSELLGWKLYSKK